MVYRTHPHVTLFTQLPVVTYWQSAQDFSTEDVGIFTARANSVSVSEFVAGKCLCRNADTILGV